MKPTDEQIQWLWEQCGLKQTRKYDAWYDPSLPEGEPCGVFSKTDISTIDLNNLFKYEPLTARGYHITTDTYKREVAGTMGQCSWAKIIDLEGNIVSCFAMKELKDALFWAIFTALGGK